MKKPRMILLFVLCIALLLPTLVSAQNTYPARGSIESYEDGLWTYYKGKTKTTVKKNAPLFEQLDTNRYLLDYAKIKGVELFLSADFKDNKLMMLQLSTPFPEYTSCNMETKDLSRSFAEIGYTLMGVTFEKKQCSQQKGSGTPYLCTADDFVCVYRLCPGDAWSLACTVTK